MKKWNVTVQDERTEEVVYNKDHTTHASAQNDYDKQSKIEVFGFKVFFSKVNQ